MRRRLILLLALATLLWLPSVGSPPVVRAASSCTAWSSTRLPPPTIRVLRTSGPDYHHVVTVDFKTYVKVVLAAEWPSSYPREAIRAGAVAVKQYAWYYVIHWRGGTYGGNCYDVVDNTNDQIYRPETKTPQAAHISAVDVTWTKTVVKNGGFFATRYRAGTWVACGSDTTGWHMLQHSARDCANRGMTADEILHVYYEPGLSVLTPPDPPTAVIYSPPPGDQLVNGSSATVAWDEIPSTDATITSRTVTLQMSKPLSGSCRSDRWLPASPPWQSTEASPQTATGLLAWYCYRFVISLTDSTGATTNAQSGTFRVDPAVPVATFTSPPYNTVTPLTTSYTSVAWTETPAEGTTIASRKLTTEYAAQPVAGSCAGAIWAPLKSTTSRSPVSVTGLQALFCYRFRVDLTDSAGHTGGWVSGVVMTPSSF
jgi:hypothetical protein